MTDSGEKRDKSRRPTALAVAAALVAIGIGAVMIAFPERTSDLVYHDALTANAESLLDAAIERNMITFVAISGVKSVIALIEGSSVGVGFDLELGDLVQPAYDYVDFIWRVFLFALMILSFYKLLMETQILGVGFVFIGAGLILWACSTFTTQRGPPFRRWGRFFIVVGVMVAYIVPASLLATDFASNRYLANVKAANGERIDAVMGQLQEARDDIFSIRDRVSLFSPAESLDEIRTSALRVTAAVTEAVWDGMFAFLTYVMVLMVELLVLPFLTAYVLYKALAIAARSVEMKTHPAALVNA